MESKLELENNKRYHFMILGFNTFKDILNKLSSVLKFYRLSPTGNIKGREIMYDVPDGVLNNAGIVLSKLYEGKKIMFKVRKLSSLSYEKNMPSQKFLVTGLNEDVEPKDYSLQIASAIQNSFSTAFTVDLDAFVRQTVAKIDVTVDADRYEIIGGTGYRAVLLCERTVYKDIKTGKKVKTEGVTLNLPADRASRQENAKLLDVIDKYVPELGLYNMSRYELAQKALYSEEEYPDDEE